MPTVAERELASRRPGITAAPSVDSLFGTAVYEGGAVALHALRLTIGDEAFFTLLRRWVAENNGLSRTTDDFIELAEEVAGQDLADFFQRWIRSPTTPDAFPERAGSSLSSTTSTVHG